MVAHIAAVARRSALERKLALASALYAAPALLLMLGVFVVPMGIIVRQSLTSADGAHVSFAAFARIAASPLLLRVGITTLQITLLATVFAVLLAYPLAYYLAQQPARRRAVLMVLLLVPFWTSVLVKSFAFTVILGHAGIINTALDHLGLPAVPLLFNRVGVVVGMSHQLLPYMVFPILDNLVAQPAELAVAAAILGAGKWRIFWRITLPLSLPGVMAGLLLVMILSLGFYVVPALLGGRQDMMLANLVDFYARESIDWSMASALSLLLAAVAGMIAVGLSMVRGGSSLLGGEGR